MMLRSLVVTIAAASSLGCGSNIAEVFPDAGADAVADTRDAASIDAPIDVTDVRPHDVATATALANALCDQFDECCTRAGLVEDHAACTVAVVGFLQPHVDDAIAAGAVPDLSAVPACREAIKAALPLCGDIAHDSGASAYLGNAWAHSCHRIVGGKQAPGATCRTHFDCAQPIDGYGECYRKLGESTGTCRAITFVGLGEPCTRFPMTDVYTECFPQQNVRCYDTCVEAKKLGEACSGRLTCMDDLWCKNGENRCVARLPAGAACDGVFDSCSEPADCDATTLTCRALSPLGGACTTLETCSSRKCTAGRCTPNDVALLPGAAASCR